MLTEGPEDRGADAPSSPGLHVALRGRGSVSIDGVAVGFATRHAELALYLLVLAGEDGLPRDQLIEALWPGIAPERARPRLRTALWQLRSALGDHAARIQRERGVIRFDLDGVTLDVTLQAPPSASDLLLGWNVDLPSVVGERIA